MPVLQQLKKYIQLPGLLFLMLFLTYQTVVIAFAHVHVVNGVMLVHSHPFKSQHDHSDGQTLVLHSMSTFHSLEAAPGFMLPAPVFFLIALLLIAPSQRVVSTYHEGIFLRGPPHLL